MAHELVDLVPWDPESADHIDRLVEQRYQCGWAYGRDLIGKTWKDAHLAGTKCMYWIVNKQADADQSNAKHPQESSPLYDTSKTLRGVPREPSLAQFIPVGHVALDTEREGLEGLNLNLPTENAYWIKSLYVSSSAQGFGFGRAAMDLAESIATTEPLNARHLLLDTLSKEYQMNEEIGQAFYGGCPKVSTQEWYMRRGYKPVGTVKDLYRDPDRNGKVWSLGTIFLHRAL